jgi:hypothetical protein
MPEKKTIERAKRAKRVGKAASTQAGEFVREEIRHIREGRHGAKSTKQAIAIGLSKARQAGVDLPPPKPGEASEKTRKSAARARRNQSMHGYKTSPKRSRAVTKVLRRESKQAASHTALSRQAKRVARQRTAAERSEIARKAAHSRTHAERSASARKAARTRMGH